MGNAVANEYLEFSSNYLPDLFRYVLPIAHVGDDGESIGSAIAINLRGRHFIATAGHCMKIEPRLINSDFYLFNDKVVTRSPVRIVSSGLHPTLDIGFIETDDLHRPELVVDQLCSDRITGGMVHIVGHPTCMHKWDFQKRTIEVTKTAFGTTLLEDSSAGLRFDYPTEGVRFDSSTSAWIRGPFIESPMGFSGGPCFGVTKTSSGGIEVVQYKLLGIQSTWHSGERWVKVVPTPRWLDFVQEQCGLA